MAAHSRAYRREQMHRIARKRIGQIRRDPNFSPTWHPLDEGRFHDEQPYLGCRRAHCGMCHADKLYDPRRTREKRAWQIVEAVAYDDAYDRGVPMPVVHDDDPPFDRLLDGRCIVPCHEFVLPEWDGWYDDDYNPYDD